MTGPTKFTTDKLLTAGVFLGHCERASARERKQIITGRLFVHFHNITVHTEIPGWLREAVQSVSTIITVSSGLRIALRSTGSFSTCHLSAAAAGEKGKACWAEVEERWEELLDEELPLLPLIHTERFDTFNY